LVYDPAKLDVGPETEAILDQLKGREYQVRLINDDKTNKLFDKKDIILLTKFYQKEIVSSV